MTDTASPPNAREAPKQPSFVLGWSPSKAPILDPTGLPLPKARRAWDRVAGLPHDQDARYKTVWKRYGLRSGSTGIAPEAESQENSIGRESSRTKQDSRVRAVKRQCLRDEALSSGMKEIHEPAPRKQYAGTKYDRRKSGHARKQRKSFTVNATATSPRSHGHEVKNAKQSSTPDRGGDPSMTMTGSSENRLAAAAKRKRYGRHSLGAALRKTSAPLDNSDPVVMRPKSEMLALNLSPRKIIRPRRIQERATGLREVKVLSTNEETSVPSQAESSPPQTLVLNGSDENDAQVVESGDSHDDEVLDTGRTSAVIEEEDFIRHGLQLQEHSDEESETDDTVSESGIGLQEAYEPTTRLDFSPIQAAPRDANHLPHSDEQGDAQAQSSQNAQTLLEDLSIPPADHVVENETSLINENQAASEDTTNDLATMDATQTVEDATLHLELDTAVLKDFLSRSAAAKASKQSSDDPSLTVQRRSSLQHRRDSNAVQVALASPRKPLEDMDINSPLNHSLIKVFDCPPAKESDSKMPASLLAAVNSVDLNFTASETDNITSSRRSSRARSRSSAASHAEKEKTNKTIQVKLTADGSNPTTVILKKTEAQELSLLTRTNTRRNKGKSVIRKDRLKELRVEGLAPSWIEGEIKEMAAINVSQGTDEGGDAGASTTWRVPRDGEKGVRWRPEAELLSYYSNVRAVTNASSDPSTDEKITRIPPPSSLTSLSASVLQAETQIDSPPKRPSAANRMRRLKSLGAGGGTPGTSRSGSALFTDDVAVEASIPQLTTQEEPRSKLPTATKKSKLVSPRKLRLGPTVLAGMSTLPGSDPHSQEAKEKEQRRLASPRKMSQFSTLSTSTPLMPERVPTTVKARKRVTLR